MGMTSKTIRWVTVLPACSPIVRLTTLEHGTRMGGNTAPFDRPAPAGKSLRGFLCLLPMRLPVRGYPHGSHIQTRPAEQRKREDVIPHPVTPGRIWIDHT